MLEPLLPTSNNRCVRWRDHRQVIDGIIHRSTGCQWRKLPDRFGPWQTVHKRHMLWSADGTWERLLQHVQALADAEGLRDEWGRTSAVPSLNHITSADSLESRASDPAMCGIGGSSCTVSATLLVLLAGGGRGRYGLRGLDLPGSDVCCHG